MTLSESQLLIPTSINHVLFTEELMLSLHGLFIDFLVHPLHLLDELVLVSGCDNDKIT